MKKQLILSGLVIGLLAICIVACRKDPDTSLAPQSLRFDVPQGWPTPFYQFANNTVTQDGFELGRKLFYDPRLSRDLSTSCGSCHQSFAAFANLDHPVSHGVEDRTGNRNSPPIYNLAWSTSFFWDGGVNHIESQPINPIQNPVEMDLTLDTLLGRLNADPDYRERFRLAFGEPEANTQRIFRALAQFMGMMVSNNALYDHYTRGEAGYTLSASEKAGMTVFEQHCASCHKPPLFTDYSLRNNGLPVNPAFHDSGRAHITQQPADLYKFKIPSLRNLKFSPPYMHDGRFKTLEEVLDHYDHGIVVTATLDPLLSNGIKLTGTERSDLLAFLNTLNDSTFTADKRFHEPRP